MPRAVLGRTAAGLLAAFAGLTVLVHVAGEVPGDGLRARLSSQDRAPTVARVVDGLTGYGGMVVPTVLVVLTLVLRGRRRDAALCTLSVAGALLGTTLLKQLVRRPRPELLPPSVEVSTFSFPSGHATVTTALVLAAVLSARGTRVLAPVAVAGALLVLGTAAAQLALGLHFPSDIVGGWLWAAAWTTGVWAALDRRPAG